MVNTLRRRQSLEAVVGFFSKKDLVTPSGPVPHWEQALVETHARAKAHVDANRADEIDAYVKEIGIEDETRAAAIKYAQWSAAAEYRLLARAGIRFDEISFDDLEHFLRSGRTSYTGLA